MSALQAAAWPDSKFSDALTAAGFRLVRRGRLDVVLGLALA
jgi:hypothetical protein